jgi:WD40 repeat protein
MERLLSISITALVASALSAAEERPGAGGLTFKLRQERLTPGLQKTPDGQLTVRYVGLKAQIIDTASGKEVGPPLEHRALRKDSRITAFAFSPDGKLVAVGTGDPRGKAMGDSAGEVRVWEVATGKLVASINPARGDIGYVHAIAFSGDGKTILVDCLELSGM